MKSTRLNNILYTLLAVTAFLCFSCQKHKLIGNDHPGYLDSVFRNSNTDQLDTTIYFSKVDSAYHALQDPGLDDLWNKYDRKFGVYYYRIKNFRQSRVYADSMLGLLNNHESDTQYNKHYIRAFLYKGDTYLSQLLYPDAFNWYFRAHELIVKQKDPVIFAEYYGKLATASFLQTKYRDAITYYTNSIQYLQTADTALFYPFANIQANLDNCGIAFVRAGMNDSAAFYFHRALAMIERNEHRFPEKQDFIAIAKAVIYGNLADVKIAENKLAEAENLLNQSILVNEKPTHAPVDAALSRIKLAKVYLAQGRKEAAATVLELAAATEKQTPFSDLSFGLMQMRSALAQANGNYQKAYEYLSIYDLARDSAYRVSRQASSSDIQQLLENLNRDYQLVLLEKENRQQSNYLWFTILLSILLVVIFVLVYNNYRRSRRNLRTLKKLNNSVSQKNAGLQQTLAALELSHQNNNRFIRIVAHDLRGPVGSITALADMLRQGNLPDDKQGEVAEAIYTSGTKSIALINDLLSDMEASSRLKDVGPVNMEDVLKYCVDLYELQMTEKKQSVDMQVFPAMVMGDREKLWRVFSNLINNAVKFSRMGGVIRIDMQKENNHLLISVHDQGIGIPENYQDKIFQSSDKSRQQGTRGEASFGLGLSISKQIIELHHGRIWFESTAGKGTSFYISLPLASAISA